jgi:hypothetical protein
VEPKVLAREASLSIAWNSQPETSHSCYQSPLPIAIAITIPIVASFIRLHTEKISELQVEKFLQKPLHHIPQPVLFLAACFDFLQALLQLLGESIIMLRHQCLLRMVSETFEMKELFWCLSLYEILIYTQKPTLSIPLSSIGLIYRINRN